MKLSQLRKLIKEEIQTVLENDFEGAPAMARPAEGYKLVDDWKEILQSKIEGTEDKAAKNKFNRYISILDKVADEPHFKFPQLFGGGYTPIKNELLMLKVVEPAGIKLDKHGIYTPPEKSDVPGVKGRPKTIDDEKKALGMSIVSKYAKGSSDFTDEEKAMITSLAKLLKKSAKPKSDEPK